MREERRQEAGSGTTSRDQEREGGAKRLRDRRENKESVWPKWLGYIGIRSWGKGSEAQILQRFRVGGRTTRAKKIQDVSMASVTGTCNNERVGWSAWMTNWLHS